MGAGFSGRGSVGIVLEMGGEEGEGDGFADSTGIIGVNGWSKLSRCKNGFI